MPRKAKITDKMELLCREPYKSILKVLLTVSVSYSDFFPNGLRPYQLKSILCATYTPGKQYNHLISKSTKTEKETEKKLLEKIRRESLVQPISKLSSQQLTNYLCLLRAYKLVTKVEENRYMLTPLTFSADSKNHDESSIRNENKIVPIIQKWESKESFEEIEIGEWRITTESFFHIGTIYGISDLTDVEKEDVKAAMMKCAKEVQKIIQPRREKIIAEIVSSECTKLGINDTKYIEELIHIIQALLSWPRAPKEFESAQKILRDKILKNISNIRDSNKEKVEVFFLQIFNEYNKKCHRPFLLTIYEQPIFHRRKYPHAIDKFALFYNLFEKLRAE